MKTCKYCDGKHLPKIEISLMGYKVQKEWMVKKGDIK